MIAYVHTSIRVLEGWFCVVVLRACVRYSSRRCVPAWSRVGVCPLVRVVACVCWFGARVWVCARVCVRVRVVACVPARVCAGWFGVCACVGGRACVRGPPLVVCCGGFLLSRTPWGAVPLARPGLASRFGMLLGVSPVL